jgi:hypothetical protein
MKQSELQNAAMQKYPFLDSMYDDEFAPNELVDKGKQILIYFCASIEQNQPKDLDFLYEISNAYVEKFNALEGEFRAAGSEIDTMARETICTDFENIAKAYGFEDVDIEELTEEREF